MRYQSSAEWSGVGADNSRNSCDRNISFIQKVAIHNLIFNGL